MAPKISPKTRGPKRSGDLAKPTTARPSDAARAAHVTESRECLTEGIGDMAAAQGHNPIRGPMTSTEQSRAHPAATDVGPRSERGVQGGDTARAAVRPHVRGGVRRGGRAVGPPAGRFGHEANIGATATVMTVAVPLAVFVFALFALYTYLVHAGDPFQIALLVGTTAVLALAVLLASAGLPMAVCLVVLMLAPLVTVLGYETVGHRHLNAAMNRALAA
jgi:hypothetical protein